VEAERGQTVRLSLLDFTMTTVSRRRCVAVAMATTTRRPGSVELAVCRPLAVVREPVNAAGDWHNVTVPARRPLNAANSRENLVYVSQGHVVQVAILTSDGGADVPYFMLKYEGQNRQHAFH